MSLSIESIDDTEINEALTKVLDIIEMEQERDFISNAELFDYLLTAFSIDTNLIPNSVSKDYAGVHLGLLYEDNDFNLLLKSFKNNQCLDPFYTLKILNDAKEKLLKFPNIQKCILDDPLESGCIVVGDLHGNFNDLNHIIQKYGIPGCDFKFIFNGDYVDRGSKQLEVLLLILHSFLIRPNRVFLNRGNHEDIAMNSSQNFNPNFLTSCRKMYGKYGSIIFKKANELFSALPLATSLENTVIKFKYFVVHGGISDSLDLDFINSKLDRFRYESSTISSSKFKNENKIISDLLWSDPIRSEDGQILPRSAPKLKGCYLNKQRNVGSLFGYDITEKFCKKYSYNAIIRSHEVRDRGFSEDHSRLFTLFSASFYCGGNNFGSIFKFLTKEPSFEVYSYKNINGDFSSLIYKRNNYLLKQFKKLIRSKEDILMQEFKIFDSKNNGFVQTDIWADIISKSFNSEISIKHLKSIKDFLCECESNLDCVNYKSMFIVKERARSYEDEHFLNIVTNLFEILDRNNDKKISILEAKAALDHLNKKLGTKFSIQDDCVNFIKQMDRNSDNYVDLEEFKQAFIKSEHDEMASNEENSNSEYSEDEEVQIVRL
ncbi:unnamed protein product [Brachionus calyciflorus]|uniref:Serine/threonine-protein phosphatase n=1 Tax=Brachionus calyciflorus TaxID=104777 RepID=A0A814GB98_9BILA|nr:unnamed protein product [Brachionus calyciflorus]